MRKLLSLAAVAGIAAAVAKKLKGSGAAPQWHQAETRPSPREPQPVPEPQPEPEPEPAADDVAGASPDEALADRDQEPHAPTDPDHPVETVEIERE